ncbi:hypothetical protein U8291_00390 [Pseudomonas sp. A2]|nr:hypothetical protein [Pseudomonas sp. A2]MEB3435485.1 hypothetical protein [Pseudomonas sp. A2]
MKSKNLLRAALVAALVSALSGCWMFMPPGGGGGHGGGGHGGGFGGHQGGGPRLFDLAMDRAISAGLQARTRHRRTPLVARTAGGTAPVFAL